MDNFFSKGVFPYGRFSRPLAGIMAGIDQTVAFLYSFWQMKLPTTFGEPGSRCAAKAAVFWLTLQLYLAPPEEESAGCQNPAQGRPKIFSYRDFMPSGVRISLSQLYY